MKRNSLIPGLVLIGIGLFLFIDKMGLVHIRWRDIWFLVLMLVGVLLYINAFTKPDRGGIFPATFLSLLGLFWAFQRYRIINPFMDEMWPMFFIIIGISFWMSFLFHRHRGGLFIWGLLFLSVGILFFAAEMGFISHWEVTDWISTYWPVVLIFFGLSIIWKNRKGKAFSH